MKLRSQNLLYFGIYMIVVIMGIFVIDYILIKNHLKNKAEENLKRRCEEIHHTIQTSLNSAIENYLRGVTEANLDIVKAYYKKNKAGLITEKEAKDAIQASCSLQTIGTSGYIVAVENKGGRLILEIHPFKRHEDCTEETGCVVWEKVQNGYAEYDWKNPEDNVFRKKVAYVIEFPEWEWDFGATSYKSELTQLLNIESIKNILSSETINGSGYAVLYDNEKNIIFHPMLEKYQDESFITEQSHITERILSKQGEISFYDWKNPQDPRPRKKYAYTQRIPEFGFYLIVTGYMSEIYSPLNKITYITILLSASAIILLLFSVFFNSRKVVEPILKIIDGIEQYYSDKTAFNIPHSSVNEIKTLAHSFFNMTQEIDKQMEEKQLTIEQMKLMNQQLTIAKHKAEESDRLKTAFLANMSHEIRTPMNAILGFTSLLKDPQLAGENQSEFIRIIEKSGLRMLNTLNDIIDISKIEAGQVEIVNSKVSIHKILNEQFVFFSPEAESKGIALSFSTPLTGDISDIITDKSKLESILTNLIKNAIKYTLKGKVEFGCSLHITPPEPFLEFYVSDTGIGIPADRLGAIFNRFEQSDIEDRKVFEGSGLGLAISKSYAAMLGGNIKLTSKVDAGSTFSLQIPYIPYKEKNFETVNTEINLPQNQLASWSNLKIIIAEDDDLSREFLSTILKNKVNLVIYAANGEEVIEECKKHPDADLILMDVKMPVMDGLKATREIRKFNQKIIIIAQTAYSLAGDREKAISAGCNEYMSKPVEKARLIQLINKLQH